MKTTTKLLLSGVAAFIIASCHHHDPLEPCSPNSPTQADTLKNNNNPTDSVPSNPSGGTSTPNDSTIIVIPGGGSENPTDSIPSSGGSSDNGSDSTFVFPTDSI